MARKTIFDIYNEQHAAETTNTVLPQSTKEVVSAPTEEVQPEKVSVQPENTTNTQPITTPLSDKGATSLSQERSEDNAIGNNTTATVSTE